MAKRVKTNYDRGYVNAMDKRALSKRRNYYDESYQKLYEETYYLGRQL